MVTWWKKVNSLISVYKVCSTSIDPTKTNTSLTQQSTILHDTLDKESIASLKITHLDLFINKITKLNHEVIIRIDTNEALTSNAGNIARLCKKCNLIDPISTKYGTAGEPKNMQEVQSESIISFAPSESINSLTNSGSFHSARSLYQTIEVSIWM